VPTKNDTQVQRSNILQKVCPLYDVIPPLSAVLEMFCHEKEMGE
jgi:hypothetical protein